MAKTFENHKCEFRTTNPLNKYGDSVYFVLADKMRRYCPINLDPKRGGLNKDDKKTSICYLRPKSVIHDAIYHQDDDSKIHVADAVGDYIKIRVEGYPHAGAFTVGFCRRKPEDGYTTFDFNNADGDLSSIYVGNAVHDVTEFNQADFSKILGGWY